MILGWCAFTFIFDFLLVNLQLNPSVRAPSASQAEDGYLFLGLIPFNCIALPGILILPRTLPYRKHQTSRIPLRASEGIHAVRFEKDNLPEPFLAFLFVFGFTTFLAVFAIGFGFYPSKFTVSDALTPFAICATLGAAAAAYSAFNNSEPHSCIEIDRQTNTRLFRLIKDERSRAKAVNCEPVDLIAFETTNRFLHTQNHEKRERDEEPRYCTLAHIRVGADDIREFIVFEWYFRDSARAAERYLNEQLKPADPTWRPPES